MDEIGHVRSPQEIDGESVQTVPDIFSEMLQSLVEDWTLWCQGNFSNDLIPYSNQFHTVVAGPGHAKRAVSTLT